MACFKGSFQANAPIKAAHQLLSIIDRLNTSASDSQETKNAYSTPSSLHNVKLSLLIQEMLTGGTPSQDLSFHKLQEMNVILFNSLILKLYYYCC